MDLALDDTTHDLVVDNGDLQLAEDLNALAQHLRQRLLMFQGEWFLDITRGLPYFQYILNKNPDLSIVDGLFKNEILTTPGVLELVEWDYDYDPATRSLSVGGQVQGQTGKIDFSQQVPVTADLEV